MTSLNSIICLTVTRHESIKSSRSFHPIMNIVEVNGPIVDVTQPQVFEIKNSQMRIDYYHVIVRSSAVGRVKIYVPVSALGIDGAKNSIVKIFNKQTKVWMSIPVLNLVKFKGYTVTVNATFVRKDNEWYGNRVKSIKVHGV